VQHSARQTSAGFLSHLTGLKPFMGEQTYNVYETTRGCKFRPKRFFRRRKPPCELQNFEPPLASAGPRHPGSQSVDHQRRRTGQSVSRRKFMAPGSGGPHLEAVLRREIAGHGGGTNGGIASANAELFDPALGSWATRTPMNVDRAHHTATMLPNGKVLLA